MTRIFELDLTSVLKQSPAPKSRNIKKKAKIIIKIVQTSPNKIGSNDEIKKKKKMQYQSSGQKKIFMILRRRTSISKGSTYGHGFWYKILELRLQGKRKRKRKGLVGEVKRKARKGFLRFWIALRLWLLQYYNYVYIGWSSLVSILVDVVVWAGLSFSLDYDFRFPLSLIHI